MKRLHLLEIEDQSWCPESVRDALTDYLQFITNTLRPYRAILPHILEAIHRTSTEQVVDLCAGSGGSWPHLLPDLADSHPTLTVRLTDKYPNLPAWQRLGTNAPQQLAFHREPVDATAVPPHLRGFRTLFTSFHHFRPEAAQSILMDAVRQRQGIGIFEFTERSPQALLTMGPTFLAVFVVTPLIRPFRWSRLFWTYVVPVVPLVVLFDGVVSCLRTYTPEELRAMAHAADPTDAFVWASESVPVKFSAIPVTYLVGYPADAAGERVAAHASA